MTQLDRIEAKLDWLRWQCSPLFNEVPEPPWPSYSTPTDQAPDQEKL